MGLLLPLLLALASQDSWPTLHRDPQRSGYTPGAMQGPFERKWYRDFHDEMIASRVEAIVAGGRVFVGTFAGTLHALDVAEGRTLWTWKAGGAIGHSPTYDDGKLYVGADDGTIARLDAATGKADWSRTLGAGIWVSPLLLDGALYFGDRAGVFHALKAADGSPLWTLKTGGMILKPASTDGKRIVFGSDDMHVYCVDPAGKLLWKSAKLQGLSMRDLAPTIWKGLAIVRTAPADGFHEVMNRNQNFLAGVQKKTPIGPSDKLIDDKYTAYILRYTPERHQAEQDALVPYLKENPWDQTFYALKLEDGKEPWLAPVLYTGGLHNPPTAPTFDPEGNLYTYYRTSLTNYSRGVRPFTGVGRLDRETGRLENLNHAEGDQPGWSAFASIGDETQSLSLLGKILISTHQGTIGGLRLDSKKWFPIVNARDTYGGIYGPGALPGSWDGEKKYQRDGYLVNMCNEWHGPDRSIVSFAEKRIFWVVGSQVVCVGGPDVPRTESGGTKAVAPIKKKFDFVVTAGGNLTADRVGGYDDKLERKPIAAEELRPFLKPPATTPGSPALRARLDAAVLELVEGRCWAPFVVELGISKEERHFTRPAEALQILSRALPHVSPEVRAKTLPYLEQLFESGFPSDAPARRRELYDLGPGMQKFSAQPPAPAPRLELYAAWAWADAAGTWDRVLAKDAELRRAFDGIKAERIDPKLADAGAWANVRIAEALGYARLMEKAGKADELKRALALLADLVADRVHFERADSNFVREVRGAHSGSVPRYHELYPELSRMLLAFCGDEYRRNTTALKQQLPLWYQAFGERMAGGENYTQTPLLARGLFATLETPLERARFLDQPWCRADLYFVEKLAGCFR